MPSSSSSNCCYKVGTIVHVQQRTGPGIFKLGGVGRVVHSFPATNSGEPERYNIDYMLGGKEINVAVDYIELYQELDRGSRKRRGRNSGCDDDNVDKKRQALKDTSLKSVNRNNIAGKKRGRVENKGTMRGKGKKKIVQALKNEKKKDKLSRVTNREMQEKQSETGVTISTATSISTAEEGKDCIIGKTIFVLSTEQDIDDSSSLSTTAISNNSVTKKLKVPDKARKVISSKKESDAAKKKKSSVFKKIMVPKKVRKGISIKKESDTVKKKKLRMIDEQNKISSTIEKKKKETNNPTKMFSHEVPLYSSSNKHKCEDLQSKESQHSPRHETQKRAQSVQSVENNESYQHSQSNKDISTIPGAVKSDRSHNDETVDNLTFSSKQSSDQSSLNSERFRDFNSVLSKLLRGNGFVQFKEVYRSLNEKEDKKFHEAEIRKFLKFLDEENRIMVDKTADLIYVI